MRLWIGALLLVGVVFIMLTSIGCGPRVCAPPQAAVPAEKVEKKELVEKPKPVIEEKVAPTTVKEAPPVVEEKEETKVAAVSDVCNVKDFPMIHFDFDKYDLKPQSKEVLTKIAEVMKKCPNMVLTIEGHCDEWGSREYNIALGWKRANEAKKFLVNLGVDEKRIKTVSFGKERPLCVEHNPTCWAKNRRDQFIIEFVK